MKLVVSTLLLLAAASSQPGESARRGRQLCGPIAVQLVLKSFGTQVSLPQLTDEIFQDSREYTSSLSSLNRTLNTHGISTLCIDLGRDQPLDWPEPVIVHFPPSAERIDGHFGVVWPRKDAADFHEVSMSLGQTVRISTRDLAAGRSRIVLLTSNRPIDTTAVLDRYPRGQWNLAGGLLIGSVIAIVARQGRGIFRKRRIE